MFLRLAQHLLDMKLRSLLAGLLIGGLFFGRTIAQPLQSGFYYADVVSDSTLSHEGPEGTLFLRPTPVLVQKHIKQIKIKKEFGFWVLEIVLDTEGRAAFFHATQNWAGKKMAIVVDNRVISAPIVQEAIAGGRVQISGNFTKAEVMTIRDQLKPPKQDP